MGGLVNHYFKIAANGPKSYELREPAYDKNPARLIKFNRDKGEPVSDASPAYTSVVLAVKAGALIPVDVHGREIDLRTQALEAAARRAPPKSVAVMPPVPAPKVETKRQARSGPAMVHVNHQERDQLGVR